MTTDNEELAAALKRFRDFGKLLGIFARQQIEFQKAAIESFYSAYREEPPPQGKLLTSEDEEPPYGSVVIDESGAPWHRTSDEESIWQYLGFTVSWSELTKMFPPIALVYVPEPKPGDCDD